MAVGAGVPTCAGAGATGAIAADGDLRGAAACASFAPAWGGLQLLPVRVAPE
ncbi:MAG TPA: hypothetical protein VLJ17_02290 [Xanthobacteraceae bacterium]|nr:hypothetical protein [Xanthobacteraceae bacterium]